MTINFVKFKGTPENIVLHSLDQIIDQKTHLEPCIYSCFNVGNVFTGLIPAFKPINLEDGLINFSSGIVSDIIKSISNFFQQETIEKYKEMKMTHKMGLVLYGPAGTGKTCTSNLIMSITCKKYGVLCLDFTGKSLEFIKYTLTKIRAIQNNPIIVFYDECDITLDREEEEYLSFLDGNDSFNSLIFLGCTNNISRIPKRIRERRSRIKALYEINHLPLEVYKQYINEKCPKLSGEDLAKFAYLATENSLVIDELKHALIDHIIDNTPIEEAIKAVKIYADIKKEY